MNSDVRQQIIVSLRAEGEGEAASKVRDSLTSIDVGLHKLQVTGIKFADGIVAAMEKAAAASAKAAEAAEQAAIKEAEAFARAVEAHEKFMEREAAATEAATLREAEAFAKAAERHEAFLAKEEAAEARAVAAADAAAVKKIKAIQDTDRVVQQHSDKVNAALEAENAETQKNVQAQLDATTQIERLKQREVAAFVSAEIDRQNALETSTRANAKAGMLQAREQQHLNDILREGAEMERTAETASVAVASAHGQASKKTSQYGFAILSLSHAFQDMQYGMSSAINNIPLIVTSLGGGAGLAGVAMAAAVSAQVLSNHIDTVKAAVTDAVEPTRTFTGTIEGLQQHIKEIEDHPIKFGVDTIEIDEAKQKIRELQAAEEAFRAAKEGKTVYEKQAGEEVAQTFAAEGPHAKEVMEKIQAQYARDLFATSAGLEKQQKIIAETATEMEEIKKELQKKINEGAGFDVIANLSGRMAAIQDASDKAIATAGVLRTNIIKESADKAGGILAGAKAGNKPEDREELVKRLRQEGEHTLANSVELSNPEEVERLADIDAKFDTGVEGIKAKYKDIRKREADEKARNAAAARNRDQLVNQEATRYATLAQAKGPGSLTDAIVGRMQRGQDNTQIAVGLRDQVKASITDVPEGLIDDVANQILDKAVGKVRAEVAAAGGAGAVASDRGEKFSRAKQAANKRTGRQQAASQEQALGGQIFDFAGGMLGQQGSMAAAHRAMQNMRHGVNGQAATMEAINHTFQQMIQMQERGIAAQANFMQMLNGFNVRLNNLHAQQKRTMGQRPGMLPMFGPWNQ